MPQTTIFHAVDCESLREILRFQVEAVFAFSVAHLAGEGDRLTEGSGAEQRRDSRRRRQVEETEGANAAAIEGERIETVPTWLLSGQLSPERLDS